LDILVTELPQETSRSDPLTAFPSKVLLNSSFLFERGEETLFVFPAYCRIQTISYFQVNLAVLAKNEIGKNGNV
jgi:hypothetical protein